MNREYTILHISDLHKSKDDSYADLFESLRKDSESYVQQGIKLPEIIVISGDIVEGAKDDDPKPDKTIKEQYKEAEEFLTSMCDFFLGGEKRRLIMVPGNHDLNRPYSKNVMTPSMKDRKVDYQDYKAGDPSLRWSWDDFSFLTISDRERYEKRFNHYVEFYNDFYNGHRITSEDNALHGNVIDLPDYNISFLALNSCHNLDRYNDTGSIFTGAVSENGIRLGELERKGRLLCGVWHHHISGLPTEHNYLDYRILSTLMRYNIQIGLFGHQHKAKVVQQYHDVTEEKEMLLICSGCLYGRAKQLSPNTSRQYNLITVNMQDDNAEIEIRTRLDESEGQFQYPSWGEGKPSNSKKSVIRKTISLTKPDGSLTEYINEVDTKTRSKGDYKYGIKCLAALRNGHDIVERYIDDYLEKMKPEDVDFVLETIGEAKTDKQAMYMLGAARVLRNKMLLSNLKQMNYIKQCKNQMVIVLRDE